MRYPDQLDYINFLFERLHAFETETESPPTPPPGRPKAYSDASLIVFFVIMTLKGIHQFRAQHRWLLAHPVWLMRLRLTQKPSRVTLLRRYKALSPKISQFITFMGDWAIPLDAAFGQEVVYQDKSLFKAKGPVWHTKDRAAGRIPEGLRNLDTDATWSKSGYHGWVYGYGLHLTTTAAGFPIIAITDTAKVNEKTILDQTTPTLMQRNIGYIVADDGYTDLDRIEQLAKQGLLLITPARRVTRKKGNLYVQYLNQPQWQAYQQQRKVAIEPMFNLLKMLLATDNNHKQLPVSGKANVATCLALGVVALQMAMVINSSWGLPLRNVTYLISLFR